LRIVMSSIMRRRSGLNSAISLLLSQDCASTAQSFKTEASPANRPANCRVSGFVQSYDSLKT
jgi:hypothetical protein